MRQCCVASADGVAVYRIVEPGGVELEWTALAGLKPSDATFSADGALIIAATSEEGREITFSIMKEGEVIGEIAMLYGGRRTATVTALTPVELLVIRRRDLLEVMRRQPEMAVAVMAAVAERLAHVSEVMEDTLFRNLPNRLARTLLVLADEYGMEEGGALRIDLKLSQTELGNLVGATREAVNKQMRAFEQSGWVKTEAGVVRLLERAPLESLTDPAG